jgi:hypothetical protein
MKGKRLAFTELVGALLVAATGSLTKSTGQTPGAPGVTYGGIKDKDPAWLRLDPSS